MKNIKGFTLIELLVSMFIFSLILISIKSSFSLSSSLLKSNKKRLVESKVLVDLYTQFQEDYNKIIGNTIFYTDINDKKEINFNIKNLKNVKFPYLSITYIFDKDSETETYKIIRKIEYFSEWNNIYNLSNENKNLLSKEYLGKIKDLNISFLYNKLETTELRNNVKPDILYIKIGNIKYSII